MRAVFEGSLAVAALFFLLTGGLFFFGELVDREKGLQRVNSQDITCVYRGRAALQCWPEVSEPALQEQALRSQRGRIQL